MDRRLMAFPVVEVAGVRIWVDQVRPVAVLQHADRPDRVVGWPSLFTGWAEPATALIPAPDGVWVHYGLLNSVDDASALAGLVDDVDAPGVHLEAETGRTSIVRVGRDQVLGASRHGLWTTATINPDPDPDAPYDGGPLPEGWSQNTIITVHRPDGSRLQTVVDRSVLAVAEIEDRVRVLVHASPAIAIPSGHGSTSYTYRPTELTLPAGQSLPAQIRFRDLVPDGWGIPADLTRTTWPQRSTMVPPVTGPASAADVEWQLVELPVEAQQHALGYTVRQFANLEQYWRPEGGGPASPLSSGLHDAKVTTSGDYPDTQVEVAFRHPAYPQGRLRRVYDVYDSAGRVRVDPHLAIWLMEDLDTGALPASDIAIDGVLTI